LTGGGGHDSFLFDTALNAATNVDTVTDFNAAADTFRLDNDIFTAFTTTGTLPAAAFSDNGLANETAADRIIYDAGLHKLFYDSDGIGGAAAVSFANLNGTPILTNTDFFIVA
jgi:serralysin